MASYGEQREKKPLENWHQKLLKRPKSSSPTNNAGSPKKVFIKGESLVVKDDILQ